MKNKKKIEKILKLLELTLIEIILHISLFSIPIFIYLIIYMKGNIYLYYLFIFLWWALLQIYVKYRKENDNLFRY